MSTCFVLGLIIMISGSIATVRALSLSMESTFAPMKESNTSPGLELKDDFDGLYSIGSDENLVESIKFFVPQNDVRFELYTLENSNESQIIAFGNATNSLAESNFNKKNPTRIFIHGWFPGNSFTAVLADAYFKKGNHNVNLIAVNWTEGANTYRYDRARGYVEAVAEYVAKFIDFLAESGGMQFKDLTVIGFSLGAHISGIAGKKLTQGRLSKIIGLDPASYMFGYDKVDERLADSDADIVEVIHTNYGSFGFEQSIGTVDFYPNGGKSQPGCHWTAVGCSHSRAYECFIESIYNPQFYARKCDSFEDLQQNNCTGVNETRKMGGEPGESLITKGIFYLKTNKQQPYALGYEGIRMAVESFSGNVNDKIHFRTVPNHKSFKTLHMASKLKGNGAKGKNIPSTDDHH